MKKKTLNQLFGLFLSFVAAFFFFLLSIKNTQAAFDPAQTFQKKCSSCHTVGGGPLKGPDLKGVTERRDEEWLVQFIKSSYSMIEAGDPIAVKLYKEFGEVDMPDTRLPEDQIRQIVQFLREGKQAQTTAAIKSALEATPEEIQFGREYYLGLRKFEKGGAACVSCHSVGEYGPLGGGTLAKDLTHSYSSFKDQGLSVALKNVAFPVMSEVYAKKPLTEDEIFQLKAFLYEADKSGLVGRDFQKKFLFLGIGGLVIAMGVIDFSWRRRRKQSVRKFQGGIR